jgi:hypothetical protein
MSTLSRPLSAGETDLGIAATVSGNVAAETGSEAALPGAARSALAMTLPDHPAAMRDDLPRCAMTYQKQPRARGIDRRWMRFLGHVPVGLSAQGRWPVFYVVIA